jgi:CxxC motif-containing protein (DUF1111 family)
MFVVQNQENTEMKVYRQLFAASLLLPASLVFGACTAQGGSSTDDPSADPSGDVGVDSAAVVEGTGAPNAALSEAVASFDGTNGFLASNGVDGPFEVARGVFEEHDVIDDGLGPVYNAQGCIECHQNPVTGAGAQTMELRAGHFDGVNFIPQAGDSLVNDRTINAGFQERVLTGNEVRTFRIALSIMGDGYVEAIDSNTLNNLALAQPAAQRGTFQQVPVLEAPGNVRGSRFGVKNQHASLLSFAADAYVNEIGITNALIPTENASNGRSVASIDTVADPEDTGNDIQAFADFMRSLPAPPRGPITAAVTRGQTNFNAAGCNVCHTPTINTAPVGSVINGGAFTVPAALGDKTIHPFGDFLLHNIGTGDGIVQNGPQTTRLQVRTMPLWGISVRNRMMHDGLSVTVTDAITRHAGQALAAKNFFTNTLSAAQQADLIAFVVSL